MFYNGGIYLFTQQVCYKKKPVNNNLTIRISEITSLLIP